MSGRVIARQERELALADQMPIGIRECVHEFGFTIVEHLMKHGIRSPAAIRELVRVIWEGARQPAQRLNSGNGASAVNRLDWVLLQAGSPISAAALLRQLDDKSFTLAPRNPTVAMIEASMHAIDGMGLLTKHDKHRIRLQAAMAAAAREWRKDK